MKLHIPLTVLAFLASGLIAQAQDAATPKSPPLHRTAAMASWTITYTYKDTKGSPAHEGRIASLTVTKTNRTYHEETTWTSGKKTDSWIYDKTYLRMTPDGQSIVPISLPVIPLPGEPPSDLFDYGHADFDGFSWLSMREYKGVDKRGGIAVFRFELPKSAASENGQGPAYSKVAFLTVDQQLPLYAEEENVERTYVYNAPPTATLTPPAEFLDVLKKMKEGDAYRHSRPSPP